MTDRGLQIGVFWDRFPGACLLNSRLLPGCFTHQYEAGYGRIQQDIPSTGVPKSCVRQGVCSELQNESPGTITPTVSKTGCWGFESLRPCQP